MNGDPIKYLFLTNKLMYEYILINSIKDEDSAFIKIFLLNNLIWKVQRIKIIEESQIFSTLLWNLKAFHHAILTDNKVFFEHSKF